MFRSEQHYEFKSYGKDASEAEFVEYKTFSSDSAARSYAGRRSIKIEGPVDVAHASGGAWDRRYMTTAQPSEYHVSGYRFERMT